MINYGKRKTEFRNLDENRSARNTRMNIPHPVSLSLATTTICCARPQLPNSCPGHPSCAAFPQSSCPGQLSCTAFSHISCPGHLCCATFPHNSCPGQISCAAFTHISCPVQLSCAAFLHSSCPGQISCEIGLNSRLSRQLVSILSEQRRELQTSSELGACLLD